MLKNAETFHCQKCRFTCSKKSNFDIHLSTAKHKKIHSDTTRSSPISNFSCLRPFKMTMQPFFASSVAMALPIPWLEPVINATLF